MAIYTDPHRNYIFIASALYFFFFYNKTASVAVSCFFLPFRCNVMQPVDIDIECVNIYQLLNWLTIIECLIGVLYRCFSNIFFLFMKLKTYLSSPQYTHTHARKHFAAVAVEKISLVAFVKQENENSVEKKASSTWFFVK